MRALYTYDIFTKQSYGGISRYISELTKHLPSDIDPIVFGGLHINRYLERKNSLGVRVPNIRYSGNVRDHVSQFAQNYALKFYKPSVIHKTYYGGGRAKSKSPMVVTIYDMIHERFPELYPDGGALSQAKRRDCAAADHIIAISESTKRDVIEYFDVPENKITVTYLAAGEPLHSTEPPATAVPQQRPFLLFVGARGGYKNFTALLQAYSASPRLMNDFDLVCFGGGAWTADELLTQQSLGLSDRVHFHTGSDALLQGHYRNAHLLIYPSLYEGFGLPLLEAMQLGCPVMCYRTSSIPEVVGEACAYIDDDFAASLEKTVYATSRLNSLTELGQQRAKQFSWQKCALETAAIYRSVTE